MKITEFTIDKKEMLRYAGHKGDGMPASVDTVADEVIKGCTAVVRPRCVSGRFGIKITDDGVKIEGTDVVFKGNDIRKHLAGCSECYIICVTVGTEADGFIRTMMAVDTLHGLLADGAATAAVESCCDTVEKQLREAVKKEGKYLTWRYSPGYGDFSFVQQPEILALLHADKLAGVTCTDSCIMIPAKSVTAVMGISGEKSPHRRIKCDECPNKDNCNFSCR